MRKIIIWTLLVCAGVLAGGCGGKPTFATAVSTEADPAIAAWRAARQAIDKLDGAPVKGLVFTVYYPAKDCPTGATSYMPDPQAGGKVAAIIASAAKGVPSVGSRVQALTADGMLMGRGVAVLAIGGGVDCKAAAVPITGDRLKTGKTLAVAVSKVNRLKLILAFSEMRLNFENGKGIRANDFLRGVLDFSPRGTVLLGGNGMNLPGKTDISPLAGEQYYNGKVVSGHVVAMGIGGPLEIVTARANEFVPAPKTAVVTKSDGPWIITLDHKPAAEVYRRLRGMKDSEKFISDCKYPVGLIVSPGQAYLRMILDWVAPDGKNKAGKKAMFPPGSLRFRGPIAKGSHMEILKGGDDAQAILDSAKTCTSQALAAARDKKADPVLLLVSDCFFRGARLRFHRPGREDEVKDGIAAGMGKTSLPVFGFYAFGQFGPIGGKYQGMSHGFMQNTFLAAAVSVK
ncbi:MAG: FIST C-terminal domain-containing protein [Phycisphaerae bacterium]|nr:FIST C-terminal domain-containing protein [Phycisphaerae bacterium]